MLGYVIKRLLWGGFVVWMISIITFCIFFALPTGDPATRIAGKNANDTIIKAINEKYHFDDPLPVQYYYLMREVLSGDIVSSNSSVEVVPQVLRGLPVTLSLAVFAAAIWLCVGVLCGIKGARSPGSLMDRGLMVAALAGISIPMPWLSLYSLKIWTDTVPIFPPGDYMSIAEGNVLGWAYHLILPGATLAVVFSGVYARMTRSNVRQAMQEEYIKTAVAKGLPERHVFIRHVLRTGLIPIIVLFGLDFGMLLGGAIFTETIFGLPGLGSTLMQGVATFDFPVLIVCTLVAATFVVVANTLVDVVQALVDPRIRLS